MSLINGIFSTMKVQFKNSLSRNMMKYLIFIEPVMSVFILYLIYNQSNKIDGSYYIIIGSSINCIINTICFSSAGDIERERFSGNLEVLISSPLGLKQIALGKILGNFILSMFSIFIAYIFSIYLLKVKFIILNIKIFILSIILLSYSFLGIALFLCAIFVVSRMARTLMNSLVIPLCVFSGIYFPIKILPCILQKVSYIIPITWANNLIKMSVYNTGSFYNRCVTIFIVMILSTIYLIVAIKLFDLIERKSIIDGNTGAY